MGKINRFFVSQDFMDEWSESCFMALPRYPLDHSPIIMISNPFDYGLISFRIFNSWLDDPDFDSIVVCAIHLSS